MMNSNYAPEIASAYKFLIDHNYDGDLRHFIVQMQTNSDLYSHSERWSIIYDWMQEHYPEATGSLITGFTCYCER